MYSKILFVCIAYLEGTNITFVQIAYLDVRFYCYGD